MVNEKNIWPPLLCQCIVYRAVRQAALINRATGKLSTQLFLRRSPAPDGTPRDKKGLSVEVYSCERLEADDLFQRVQRNNKSFHAVASLHVGKVRDVRLPDDADTLLDIVQDEETHANITGLPAFDEDVEKAEKLATELVSLCKTAWIKSIISKS